VAKKANKDDKDVTAEKANKDEVKKNVRTKK